jgi:putative oligomerization/nucleic acid binding protein
MRRRRGRGLIGTAARTAVIAGTATAVSNKVGRQQAPAHRAAPAGDGAAPDRIAQLERLNKLKESGALTEDEFRREKAKLLAS